MSSSSKGTLDAVVWIVIPNEVLDRKEAIEDWLERYVKEWIEALNQGARAELHIKSIILIDNAVSTRITVQAHVRAVLSSTYGITEVSFKQDSCLRITYTNWKDAPGCDLSGSSRDHQVYRLLLVDELGRGYPCYGAWKAVQDGESDIPDQSVMRRAYSNGSFRYLCRECVNGHPDGNWKIFPCSRYGCQVWSLIWGGTTEYPHVQFTGQGDRWCRHFTPDFEISLEQSRSRLERLLFDDEFWRNAFIEEQKPLDLFWPEDKESGSNIIPLYTSGQERYSFKDDTPSSLGKYPASNYFPHHPHDLDKYTLSDLRKQFLPICFLPHLRVLFELTEEVLLLSVILTDPFTNSEFNYRSLYRDGSDQPGCFENDVWKLLWRLPNTWPQWKDVVLNLSSAIRRKVKHHDETLQEPQEYVITLIRNAMFQHTCGKDEINLIDVWEGDFGNWRSRADTLKMRAQQYAECPDSLSKNVFDEAFLSVANAEDESSGKEVWQTVDRLPVSKCFYVHDHVNGWVSCFGEGITDMQKARFGCSLLNYLIWVRAIFGNELCTIETFNSTNLSQNKPSQFVAYTTAPLDQVARARFKLTLSTLLQPIEGAYAIHTEMISEKARLHLEKKDAEISAKKGAIRHYGHTMGHRISPVVAYFEGHDPTTEAAACARLVHDMTLILQAYAVQNQMEFFRLNSEKGGRFVEYDEPLDLLSLLEHEVKNISAKDVQMPHGIVYRFPEYDIYAKQALVGLDLDDSVTRRRCRLRTAFYAQLLSELVINAVQHGWHNASDEVGEGKQARVRIRVDTIYLHNRPALVLTNYYSEEVKPAPTFFRTKWEPWPKDRENDGPGMALSVFGAVQAGRMMLKVTPPIPDQREPGQVHVALLLDGLRIG